MPNEENDPSLYEPFAVQEIHLDGFFNDARIDGETFRATAFSMQSATGEASPQPVAVVRLIMPIRSARHFIEQASSVLRESEAKARSTRSRRRRV